MPASHRRAARLRGVGVGLALTLTLTLTVVGCGSDRAAEPAAGATTTVAAASARRDAATPPAPGPVVKDVLGQTVDPPGAPGRTLTLIRYTIPAGARLAPHIHPGVQLAAIESGRLSYTVVSGTVRVRRAGADADEELTGPTSTVLGRGDAVVEVDGMVHFGANDTRKPVVILATLLTKDDEDLAIPVTTTTTAAATTTTTTTTTGG